MKTLTRFFAGVFAVVMLACMASYAGAVLISDDFADYSAPPASINGQGYGVGWGENTWGVTNNATFATATFDGGEQWAKYTNDSANPDVRRDFGAAISGDAVAGFSFDIGLTYDTLSGEGGFPLGAVGLVEFDGGLTSGIVIGFYVHDPPGPPETKPFLEALNSNESLLVYNGDNIFAAQNKSYSVDVFNINTDAQTYSAQVTGWHDTLAQNVTFDIINNLPFWDWNGEAPGASSFNSIIMYGDTTNLTNGGAGATNVAVYVDNIEMVPEPSTMLLFLPFLGGLGLMFRRKTAKA